ncbi:MAG: flippase [Candidatus Micrarchaeota archaeon]
MEQWGEVSQNSKEVAKGSFWSLAGSLAFKLSSFVYSILLARAASQDDIGMFQLILAIMTVISFFSDMGISSALVRYVPFFQGRKEPGKIKALINISHVALCVSSAAIMAVLWLGADMIGQFYQNPQLPEALRVMSAYVLLFNIFRMHYLFLQGMADIKSYQSVTNLQNLLKLALTAAAFYLFGASIFTISVAFLLSHLLAIGVSSAKIISLVRSLGPSRDVRAWDLLREIAPFGMMMAAVQYISILLSSTDRIMLGYLLEPAKALSAVAIYSYATTLAGVLMLFPYSVGGIFLPVISRLAGKGESEAAIPKAADGKRAVLPAEMTSAIETAQRWCLFLTLPIAVVMIAFSGEMLGAIFGAEYAPGAVAMAIFTFGIILNSIYYIISLALAAMRFVRIELNIALLSGALNILLNLLLIPAYGIEGAAIASVASFALALILSAYYGRSLFGFSFPPDMYKLLAAAVIALAVMLLIKPILLPYSSVFSLSLGGELQGYASKIAYLAYLSLLITISIALFLLLAMLLKCISREDIGLMKKAMARAMVPPSLISLAEKAALYGVKP